MLTGMEYQNLGQDGLAQPPPVPEPSRPRAWRAGRVIASTAAAAGLLAGGAAIGIAITGGASAATGSPAASTSTPARSCKLLAVGLRHSGHPAVARRIAARCDIAYLRLAAAGGIHGQITFKTKTGTRTLAFERGAVQTVSGSALTVRAADGVTWTWDLLAKTVIRESGHSVGRGALASGDQVLVVGQIVDGTNDARLVRIRAPG